LKATDRAPLGGTELTVTRLGLGTVPLGGLYEAVSEEQAHAVVERAWQRGLRFFDTAPLYGHGLSEQRLGHVLRDKPRGEAVISTKVGRLLRSGAPADPAQRDNWRGVPDLNPVFDFSREGVLRSFEESRERLGLERVDAVLIHDPDDAYSEALAGAYPALAQLRGEGSIAAIGVGMNQWQMLEAFGRDGAFDCFLLAGRYTLLDQSGLDTLLPLCQREGISIIAGGVYNSGILADPDHAPHYDYRPAGATRVEQVRRIREICERHGVALKAAAIRFPLGHPAVTCVIVGCRSPEEVDENVDMFETPIPEELWNDLRAAKLLGSGVPVPVG
jgi:D-threo-aldose 1-dehydrogenase